VAAHRGTAWADTRTWTFALGEPGTYKVQVEHRAKGGVEPYGTKVHYGIQIGTQSQSRDLDLFTDHPFIPLIVDLPHRTKMRVAISGLSDSLLRATRVFVYDANSQAPGEYFDPAKSIELPTVRQVRTVLKESEATLDLAKAKITLDRMVDPTINLERTLQEIDSIIARIRSMPEFGTVNETKLEALRRYLYDAGEWNDHRMSIATIPSSPRSHSANFPISAILGGCRSRSEYGVRLFSIGGSHKAADARPSFLKRLQRFTPGTEEAYCPHGGNKILPKAGFALSR
jgi:hypothetical protein